MLTTEVADEKRLVPDAELSNMETGMSEGKYTRNLQVESTGKFTVSVLVTLDSSPTVVITPDLATLADANYAKSVTCTLSELLWSMAPSLLSMVVMINPLLGAAL